MIDMTLIAAWKEQGTPVLIGDVIISRDGINAVPNIPLPTRSDVDRLLTQASIVEMCQKVYKVSDNFAIGWAGVQLAAKNIIRVLIGQFNGKQVTLAEVKECLRKIVGWDELMCVIIGWVYEEGQANAFRWDSTRPDMLEVGNQFIDGSGNQYFNSIFTPLFAMGHDPVENTLTKMAHVIKDEVLYGTNIKDRFGGGFTVIYHNGQRFVIVPSITFIFLQVEETEDENRADLLEMKRVLKFQQIGPMLEMMAVLLGRDSVTTRESQATKLAPHEMHYAAPITAKPDQRFLVNSNLSFKSTYYCICIDIKMLDHLPGMGKDQFVLNTLILCQTNEEKRSFIDITEQPGQVEGIELKDELFQRILSYLKKVKLNRAEQANRRTTSLR
jgi:hypothetical protein